MRPGPAIIVPVLDGAPSLASRLRALGPLRRRGVRVVVACALPLSLGATTALPDRADAPIVDACGAWFG